ncbi:hypothetical protein ES703_77228 [subsurface metagenome]
MQSFQNRYHALKAVVVTPYPPKTVAVDPSFPTLAVENEVELLFSQILDRGIQRKAVSPG